MQRLGSSVKHSPKCVARHYHVTSKASNPPRPQSFELTNSSGKNYEPSKFTLEGLNGLAGKLYGGSSPSSETSQAYDFKPSSWRDAPKPSQPSWRNNRSPASQDIPRNGFIQSSGFLSNMSPQSNGNQRRIPTAADGQQGEKAPQKKGYRRAPVNVPNWVEKAGFNERKPSAPGFAPQGRFRAVRTEKTGDAPQKARRRPRNDRAREEGGEDTQLTPEEEAEAEEMVSVTKLGKTGLSHAGQPDFAYTDLATLGRLSGPIPTKGLSPQERAGDYSRYASPVSDTSPVHLAQFVLSKQKDASLRSRRALADVIQSSTTAQSERKQVAQQKQASPQKQV
jgi:hypothetical protein